MSIKIKKRNDDVFEVAVAASVSNAYEVTVTNQSLSDLTDKNVTKIQLFGFSFNFLPEREPNTSTLSSIDIMAISKYFSNYTDEVRL